MFPAAIIIVAAAIVETATGGSYVITDANIEERPG